MNDNISRSGAGISFRKSFGSFSELFGRKPDFMPLPSPPAVVPVPAKAVAADTIVVDTTGK